MLACYKDNYLIFVFAFIWWRLYFSLSRFSFYAHSKKLFMKKILVENVEDGMILARDVYGSSGSALLNKGTRLTMTMGRRLKNWGVPFVCIEGEEERQEEKPALEISSEEIRQQLEEKFADVMDNPVMQKLFNAVYTFKTNSNTR